MCFSAFMWSTKPGWDLLLRKSSSLKGASGFSYEEKKSDWYTFPKTEQFLKVWIVKGSSLKVF